MNEPRFYSKEGCSTLIEVICADPGASFSCCGKELTELKANTSEGASEKHLPVVEQNGNTVTVNVGSIAHPMTEEHSIGFICLETEKGLQRVPLKADGDPKACFALTEGDKPVAAYAYCNLHGFWKTEIR